MLKQILPFLLTLFVFSAATAQKNNNAAAFFRSGIDFKNKNMISEAMVAFNKALSLNRNYDSVYVEIADINLKNGHIDHAIKDFKQAVSINPANTTALFSLGKIYRDVRPNLDSALIFFKAAVQIDSTNKEYFYSIAWCYNAKGENVSAIPYAVKALEIDNTYKPAYNELGHAYHRSKKYAEGIEQFKKNLAVSVVDLPLLYTGYCYTELKDKEGALRQYEELKKVNAKMAESLKRVIDKME